MHHIRTLKSANKNTPWGKQMLLMNRKTIAVCEECFAKSKKQSNRVLTNGEPYTWEHVRMVRGQTWGNQP